jgi:lipoprotein-anchoring transpeptidase ErfK/SrfK
MYFFADFAIHGAYWRSSFGYSASHGCVNVPVADSAWLYAWAPIGTRVEVHY